MIKRVSKLSGMHLWTFFPAVLAVVVITAGTALANSPPVADAGPDQTIYLGDDITLHGTATDPDGDPIVGWEWEVISAPPGSTYTVAAANTANPTFLTDTLGDYVLTLIARDYFAWGDPDSVIVTVVENHPPTAVAAASPTSGQAPLTVQFDATASFDPEGGPLWYDWIFDDGTYGTGATPTHVFQWDQFYPYQVVLGVTDDHGNDDFVSIEITVTPGGNIKVSPTEYDFGDVQLGGSSPTIITLTNPPEGQYEDDVNIMDIYLAEGSSDDFAITASPAPITISPGGSVDVVITFTPSDIDYITATLEIASDDPVFR